MAKKVKKAAPKKKAPASRHVSWIHAEEEIIIVGGGFIVIVMVMIFLF